MTDRVAAVILLVLALAFGIRAWSYVAPAFTDVLGARLFPIAIAVFMAPLAVMLFIEGHAAEAWPGPHAWRVLAIALITLVVYAFVIEYVGYLVATTGVFVVFATLFHARWWQGLVAGAIASAILYALFVWALDLYLPVGGLFEEWF